MNDNEEQVTTHELEGVATIYPLFIQLPFSQIWIEDDYKTIGVNGDVLSDLENEDKSGHRYQLSMLLFNMWTKTSESD